MSFREWFTAHFTVRLDWFAADKPITDEDRRTYEHLTNPGSVEDYGANMPMSVYNAIAEERGEPCFRERFRRYE